MHREGQDVPVVPSGDNKDDGFSHRGDLDLLLAIYEMASRVFRYFHRAETGRLIFSPATFSVIFCQFACRGCPPLQAGFGCTNSGLGASKISAHHSNQVRISLAL